MTASFLPPLLVPIVGLLTPFLIILIFLIYVDKDLVD